MSFLSILNCFVKAYKIIFIILFFYLFISLLNVSAQTYSYRHYTIFDGLPQNQVGNVYQDKYGFIWVWTKGGVSRFDGKTFKNYSTEQYPNGYFVNFFEINNSFYLCTSHGIAVLKGENFHTIVSLKKNEIYSAIYNSNTSEICFCVKNKIIKINCKGKQTKCYNLNVNFIYDMVMFNKNNTFFYTTDSGLYVCKKNTIKKITYGYCGKQILINNLTYIIFPYSPDYLNKDYYGICCFDGKNLKRIYNPKTNILSNGLAVLSNNNIIVIQNNSTWIKMDTKGNVIDKDSLPDVTICNIFIDRSNTLWLATENGLYQQQSSAFKNYDEKSGMPKYVWTIFEDKSENIVFATFNGKLVKLKNNQLIEVTGYKNKLDKDESFYPNGFCNSLGQWMLPTNRRVVLYNSGQFSLLDLIAENKRSCVLCCYEDNVNGEVFLGSAYKLFKYNLKTKKCINYSVKNANVLFIEPDKFNRLWVCTSMGIYMLNNDTIVPYNRKEPIFNSGTCSCKLDNKGNMWLAQKNGLYLYDNKKVKKLYNGSFNFISLYKNKHIIAGSTLGVLYIDLDKFYSGKKNSFRFFDRYNGFIGIECGQNATCIDNNGNVWIPTSESVVKFMPERIVLDTVAPITYIYSVESAKSDWVWKKVFQFNCSIANNNMLKYNQNNIKINFHALSYPCPDRVRYKYRLIGYNNSWAESREESIIYTNLEPGEYCFEVRACNENNYWNNNATIFKFKIIPAFWQTTWFIIFFILLNVIIVASIVYFYMKRKQIKENKQREIEQKLIKMQVSTINSQLDPHFIFNAIAAIGSEVQEKNNDKAYEYFVKVSHLLRNSLKDSEKITRTLHEEIKFVENYLLLQKFRFEDRFDYKIEVDKLVKLDTIVPKMCIQIFVENSMKHGLEHKIKNGKLLVTISNSNNGVFAVIEDNGVGRIASSKFKSNSTGVGLKVFKEFFFIMNKYNNVPATFYIKDLYTKDNEPDGTKVKLFIPYNYKFIT